MIKESLDFIDVGADRVEAIINIYLKKNYSIEDIGMNIALFILYEYNNYKYLEPYEYNNFFENIMYWYDYYLIKYIKEWNKIKLYIDKHLQLLRIFE